MLNKPPVIFPDVEAWALTYLRAALLARPIGETYADNVTVSNKAPTTLPARLVTVRDDGGPRSDTVTRGASLGVNVWAETDADCVDLARLVAALLEAAPGNGPVVAHLGTSGPYPVPEQSTKSHRYLSVDLSVRGLPL